MPGVRFLSLFLLLFLLPDEIVSIFWTGAGLAERESEGEEEVVGTAVPGRAVRWYPRGSSAAGVKIRERVEEIRYDRPNSLHRVDWKISGQGIFVGPSSFLLFSLPLSLSFSRGLRNGRRLQAVMSKIY